MDSLTIGSLNLLTRNGGELKISELPPRTLALDGIVRGPAAGDDEDRWSFDHHDACVRLVTAATCEQVHTALLLGLDATDRPIALNDLDGDTLLSLWLLANPARLRSPVVRHLVRAVGVIDAHGPAGKQLLDEESRALADTFYYGAILPLVGHPGEVQEKYGVWEGIILNALTHIDQLVDGHMPVEKPKVDYTILDTAEVGSIRACLASSPDFGAFDRLYDEGFRVAVLTTDAADDSRRFTVAKTSDLVRFPLGPDSDPASLLGRLKALEPGWGGGSSIGGSPRLEGGVSSRLYMVTVWDEVLALLDPSEK